MCQRDVIKVTFLRLVGILVYRSALATTVLYRGVLCLEMLAVITRNVTENRNYHPQLSRLTHGHQCLWIPQGNSERSMSIRKSLSTAVCLCVCLSLRMSVLNMSTNFRFDCIFIDSKTWFQAYPFFIFLESWTYIGHLLTWPWPTDPVWPRHRHGVSQNDVVSIFIIFQKLLAKDAVCTRSYKRVIAWDSYNETASGCEDRWTRTSVYLSIMWWNLCSSSAFRQYPVSKQIKGCFESPLLIITATILLVWFWAFARTT